MRIMLTGANGQVGWELSRSLLPLGDVVALTRAQCDLSRPESLPLIIQEINPDVIVNAAAYTAVDKAEEEEELATIINGTSVGVLAEEAKKRNALFIHYSTDYVFDGTKQTPYTEEDIPNPINAYGRSKLAGEEIVRQVGVEHLIFRTSWVYAARGNNFPKTILRLASERNELKVIADQFGSPTSAELIADVTALSLYRIHMKDVDSTLKEGFYEGFKQGLAKSFSGTYHLTAAGETSWYDYAKLVLELAKKSGYELKVSHTQIVQITTADFPSKAVRPSYSVLSCEKLKKTFGLEIPTWEKGLCLCIQSSNLTKSNQL